MLFTMWQKFALLWLINIVEIDRDKPPISYDGFWPGLPLTITSQADESAVRDEPILFWYCSYFLQWSVYSDTELFLCIWPCLKHYNWYNFCFQAYRLISHDATTGTVKQQLPPSVSEHRLFRLKFEWYTTS